MVALAPAPDHKVLLGPITRRVFTDRRGRQVRLCIESYRIAPSSYTLNFVIRKEL